MGLLLHAVGERIVHTNIKLTKSKKAFCSAYKVKNCKNKYNKIIKIKIIDLMIKISKNKIKVLKK